MEHELRLFAAIHHHQRLALEHERFRVEPRVRVRLQREVDARHGGVEVVALAVVVRDVELVLQEPTTLTPTVDTTITPTVASPPPVTPDLTQADAVRDGDERGAIVEHEPHGTLKEHLIAAVRDHAAARACAGDTRWAPVAACADDQIWAMVEFCEWPRGAISLVARRVNKLVGEEVHPWPGWSPVLR